MYYNWKKRLLALASQMFEEKPKKRNVERELAQQALTGFLLSFTTLDSFVEFTSMDRHFLRGLDSQPHLASANFNHRQDNVFSDDDTFIRLAS